MAKFTPQTIQNLDNPPTAVAQINYNFSALQLLIDTLLSRNGALPNSMLSNLDMNANRILNLPVPVSPTEPARHGDIQQYVDSAQDWAEYAEDQADRAEQEADNAAESAQQAEDALLDLRSRYIGAYVADPAVDGDGNPLLVGALYFNITLNILKVFAVDDVHMNGDPVFAGDPAVIIGYWIPLPAVEFSQLNDVNLTTPLNNDYFYWNGTEVRNRALSATLVPYTPSIIQGSNVQTALDEIGTRTSLGVYDIVFYAQGLPGVGEQIFNMVAARAFSIPVGATGSVARLRVAPSGDAQQILLLKNGVQFGTVNFADGATVATFTVAGAQTFAPGDTLSLAMPGTVNIAVRDISITLACRR